MANVNKVILIGNVTRDPEVKFTPKGSAVTEIGLAVNRSYSLDNGEKREEVTFIDVTFWGRQAETIGQYLSKGRPIFVEGRLKLDQWDDKESGQKRSKLKVVCENFQFIGAPKGGAEVSDQPPAQRSAPRPVNKPAPAAKPAAAAEEEVAPPASDGDDNIPF